MVETGARKDYKECQENTGNRRDKVLRKSLI